MNVAAALVTLDRPGEALAAAEHVLEIEPDQLYALHFKALTLALLGRTAETAGILARIQQAVKDRQLPEILSLLNVATVQLPQGRRAEARRSLDQLVLATRQSGFFPDFALVALVRYGHAPLATTLATQFGPESYGVYDFLLLLPGLAPLRADLKFAPYLAKSRKNFEIVAKELNDARLGAAFGRAFLRGLAPDRDWCAREQELEGHRR